MVGELVKNFQLPDNKGNLFDLYSNLVQKVMLVFYPKDNSPVCSSQLRDYAKQKEKFEEIGISIFGLNPGSVVEHNSFCENTGINFPLLIDENKEVCMQFNALYFNGMVKRKIVIIDADKKIFFEKTTLPFMYLNSERIFSIINSKVSNKLNNGVNNY